MLSKLRKTLVCTIALLCTAAQAATLNVGPGQTYATIQSAINAAATGDTVLVAPGTYYEQLTISGKEITIASTSGPRTTIIDGQGNGNVIEVDHTPTTATTIAGFTVQHGFGKTTGDAAIFTMYAGVTATNNIFTGNNYVTDIVYGAIVFSRNIVHVNLVDGRCGFVNSGTGVVLFGISAILDANGKLASSLIDANTFIGPNVSDAVCGTQAINADVGSPLTISNNSFTGWGGAAIGFFPSSYGTITIVQNLFFNNYGGSIFTDEGFQYPPADPAVFFILNNTMVNDLLPAKTLNTHAEISIEDVYSKVAIENNVIYSPSSADTILSCSAPPSSASNPLTPIILDHNLFWAPIGTLGDGGCSVTVGSFGNISADPGFISSSDFHLSPSSPAIDAGNTSDIATTLDYDSHPRVQNGGRASSPIVDMGAYEFAGDASKPWSLLSLTASNYYLTASNTVTISSNLVTASQGIAETPISAQPIIVYENGGNPQAVTTDTSGNATTPTYFLPTAGLYTFTASYAGGKYPPAISAPLYVYVLKAAPGYPSTTTLTCNPSTLPYNTTSLLTASVTSANGTPTGSIAFTDNGTPLATNSLISGITTLTYTGLIAGTHTLLATYVPTGSFAPGSATCTITVQAQPVVTGTLTATPEPSTVDSAFNLTATLTPPTAGPALTGAVTFAIDGTTVGNGTLGGNTATLLIPTPTLAAGTHQLTATWPGNGTYPPVNLTGTHTVTLNPVSLLLSSSLDPSSFAQNVIFNVVATVTQPTPAVGRGAYGFQLTGTLSFYDGATLLARIQPGYPFTFSTTSLIPGSHNITAFYSGDTVFAAATSNVVVQIVTALPTTSILTVSPTSTTFGNAVTLTANVSPAPPPGPSAPNGTVTFLDGSTLIGTATLTPPGSGTTSTASLTLTTLAPGTHNLTCTYAASTPYLGSSCNTLPVTVAPVVPDLTLTAVPNPGYVGQVVTFNATIGAASGHNASGNIVFLDSGTPIGSVALGTSGIVKFPISTLAMGTHPITATFAASGSFASAVSNTVQEVILGSDFTLALAPPAITLQAGQTTTVLVQLNSVGNFTGPLALTYGPLPTYATATLAPTTVTLTAGGSATAILTLNTARRAANTIPPRPGSHALPITFAAALLLLISTRKRRNLARLLTLLLAAAALQTLTGCTNAWYELSLVAPGTYPLAITATDNAGNAHSATLSITVVP